MIGYSHVVNDDPPNSTPDEVIFVRDDAGRFAPGTIPPVRKKGALGGRALALKTLDVMLGKETNQENLMNALQAHFDDDPVRFFKQIVMPLLPTEVKMKLTEEGGFSWLSLPDMIRMKASSASTSPVIDVSASSVAEDAGARRSALPPNS
jgi:hypothetical protein